MKKFIKSIWFPIILFLALEGILYFIGSRIGNYCPAIVCRIGEICNTCEPTQAKLFLEQGVFPSLAISLITYFSIKKFYK